MSKRLSTQRSLAAALSNENTPAAPAAASPTGQTEGSGATSQALVVAQPPLELASPAASPEPKRSRPAEPIFDMQNFDASQPGFFDKLNPDKILSYVFWGSTASLIELCKQLFHQGRLVNGQQQRRPYEYIFTAPRPRLQIYALFSLLGRSIYELWPPKPLTTTLTESSIRALLSSST
eukprot:jgi/Mesvir1/9674/Mv12157-RA.1